MQTNPILRFTAAVLLFVAVDSASAQVGQLGGGNAAGGLGGGGNQPVGGAPTAGGTLDGPGGLTTQGPGALTGGDGGLAGANVAQEFVGGNNSEGFVGGRVTTQANSNRQFRAITAADVPTGGSTQTSGTQRRVPVSLKIAFSYPVSSGSSLLIGSAGPPIRQIMTFRPDLQGIDVSVDGSGQATLTGAVPDTDAARLAANLVRLRPGIRKVDNQLQVVVR